MSSNTSAQYLDFGLPFLEVVEYDLEAARRRREERAERDLLCRDLALIELASCFRNGPEPLFGVLSPILWDHNRSQL